MQALNCISKSAQKLCSADRSATFTQILLPVVGKIHNAIHRINHYPANSTAWFVNTYIQPSNNRGLYHNSTLRTLWL